MASEPLHQLPSPTASTVEAGARAREQAERCAAGDHVYTWSGRIVDIPGGSPHLVMACAYGALHEDGCVSPRRIGPRLTPESMAKRLWTAEELEQAAPEIRLADSDERPE